jgi:hypothetical protein
MSAHLVGSGIHYGIRFGPGLGLFRSSGEMLTDVGADFGSASFCSGECCLANDSFLVQNKASPTLPIKTITDRPLRNQKFLLQIEKNY